MSTLQVPIQKRPPVPAEQRFLLRAIDWPTYRAISDALTGLVQAEPVYRTNDAEIQVAAAG